MSWLLLKEIRIAFVKRSPLISFIIKVFLLLLVAVTAGIAIFILHFLIIKELSLSQTIGQLRSYFLYTRLATDSLLFWMVMLLSTLVIVEIDQKYSPGVFWEVLTGKYLKPRNEKRIIMFLDLKDSTPIAEQLGHEKYFLFIKDFIYWVSRAILEHEGMIYQYVGDEVVVTWPYEQRNILKSLNAVVDSRKSIQRNSDYFRREYDGIVPEFRVG
jgi:adenylate cyclase